MSAAATRVRTLLGPISQTALAAALAWYAAHDLLGHAQPFFAPIAAAVALSTSHIQRARRTVQMVVGVLLGIGVSELLHPLVGSGALAIGIVVAVTLLVSVALAIGFVGEGMMFVNQAAASAILVIALHKAGTGAERAVDALVGGAVALVIGVGMFPADPLALLWGAEDGVLRALLEILERRPSSAPAGSADMDWALASSHELHRRLSALTQARRTARMSVRVAPRRLAMRARVDREEERVSRMYVLASSVLSLMRTTFDESAPEVALQAERAFEVEQLTGALRILLDAPRPWSADALAGAAGSLRELLARSPPREPPQSAVRATLCRRVAADVIAVLGLPAAAPREPVSGARG